TSDDSSGRATSISVVFSRSESDCTALRYISFLSPRPDKGPKQEAPCVPSSKKPVQAVGSDNKRSVWPVGAISNNTWAYRLKILSSAKRGENSSNAASYTVHDPVSCSSIIITTESGSFLRYGPIVFSR